MTACSYGGFLYSAAQSFIFKYQMSRFSGIDTLALSKIIAARLHPRFSFYPSFLHHQSFPSPPVQHTQTEPHRGDNRP